MKTPVTRRVAAIVFTALAIVALSSTPALADTVTQSSTTSAVFELPAVPFGIVALIGFLSPLAIAVVNQPIWPAKYKKAVAVIVAAALAAASLIIYYSASQEPLPQWWVLLLVAIAASQTSYAIFLKKVAARIETATTLEE